MPRSLFPLLRSLLLVAVLAAVCARAQSVRWEPAGGSLAREQISALRLVFQDAEPSDTPTLPATPGLVVEPNPARSEQSTFNVTFGSQAVRQRTITYTYRVRPTLADGEIRVPAFTVETDNGTLTVPAATFSLANATVGQSALPLDQIASARFTPPAAAIWAGEVFKLTHTLDVDRRYATNSILAAPLQWTATPLIAEEWSKPVGAETSRNGQARLLVTNETRAIAPDAASSLPLPPATQLVNLPTGSASPFSLFGGSTFEQFTITSAPATLLVRPLPSPAPADFAGAVGRFT
ncbi:MAG: BatD family protein, partial [Opitutaceae bacterium]|nr:BatD family protein [Opitutaceae bacterium]